MYIKFNNKKMKCCKLIKFTIKHNLVTINFCLIIIIIIIKYVLPYAHLETFI